MHQIPARLFGRQEGQLRFNHCGSYRGFTKWVLRQEICRSGATRPALSLSVSFISDGFGFYEHLAILAVLNEALKMGFGGVAGINSAMLLSARREQLRPTAACWGLILW